MLRVAAWLLIYAIHALVIGAALLMWTGLIAEYGARGPEGQYLINANHYLSASFIAGLVVAVPLTAFTAFFLYLTRRSIEQTHRTGRLSPPSATSPPSVSVHDAHKVAD